MWVAAMFGLVALWARGANARASWKSCVIERYEEYLGEGKAPMTFFIVDGAFNGPEHTEQMVRELRLKGDVWIFDFARFRFDLAESVEYVWSVVRSVKGRKILIGWSLGGLVMFRALYYAYADDRKVAEELELAIGDSPLGLRHLLFPDGKGTRIPPWLMKRAKLLRFVHPGPVTNWLLSRVIAKASFKEMPEREPGADMTLVRRHMAHLHRNRLSLMIDQIVSIIFQPDQHPIMSWRNRVTYLQCEMPDVVIDAEPALEEWKQHFPHLVHLTVTGARHVSLPECPEAYSKVMAEVAA